MRTLLIGALAATLVGCKLPFTAASKHRRMYGRERVRLFRQDGLPVSD